MSFERPLGANARADQTTVRRANLGVVLKAYDPVAMEEAQKAFREPGVTYCDRLDSAIADVEAVVVVTPWKEFRDLPAMIRGRQPEVVFVDARRAFSKDGVTRYEGIGL